MSESPSKVQHEEQNTAIVQPSNNSPAKQTSPNKSHTPAKMATPVKTTSPNKISPSKQMTEEKVVVPDVHPPTSEAKSEHHDVHASGRKSSHGDTIQLHPVGSCEVSPSKQNGECKESPEKRSSAHASPEKKNAQSVHHTEHKVETNGHGVQETNNQSDENMDVVNDANNVATPSKSAKKSAKASTAKKNKSIASKMQSNEEEGEGKPSSPKTEKKNP